MRVQHTRRSAIVQSDIDEQNPSDEDYKEPVRPAKRLRTSAPSALDAPAVANKKPSLTAAGTPPVQKHLDSAASSPQLAAKRSALSATLKKLNSNSAPAAQPPVAQKSLQMSGVTPLNRRAPIVAQRAFGSSAAGTAIRRAVVPVPVVARRRDAEAEDDHDGGGAGGVEQHTPTFTIVNINDIINQKKDCVIEQTSGSGQAAQTTTTTTAVRRGRPLRSVAAARVDSDDVDYQPGVDTEADDGSMDDDDDDIDESGRRTRTINRRKAQHIIMSERMKAVKPAAAAAPKLLNTLKNAVPAQRPYRNIIKQNGQASTAVGGTKPAPRILNSTLCRNVSQLEAHPQIHTIKRNVSVVGGGGGGENNLNTTNANNNNVLRTYAGTNRSAAAAAAGGATTATTGLYNANARKAQPPPKTVISHQVVPGGQTRRVRKITCYETWFVIKLPTADPAAATAPKAELAISLVRLGNEIGTVALPSDAWSYKVSLQRKPLHRGAAVDGGDTAAEVYTGDLHDANIPEADRRLFAPTNIMFRRSSANPLLRMQFDRAVIFKNGAFYINIEGKNVRLLAAPAKLQSLAELEVLLEIVDSVTLNSSLVEQMAYA